MPAFYAFTFVHCTAFYSPATEALINNNNNNNCVLGKPKHICIGKYIYHFIVQLRVIYTIYCTSVTKA